MSYQRQKEVLEMPNLIEVQKDSYQWFLDEGLQEAFDDISPIEDYSGHLSLEFVGFELCEDDNKGTGSRHQRQITHENLMLGNLIFFFIIETHAYF